MRHTGLLTEDEPNKYSKAPGMKITAYAFTILLLAGCNNASQPSAVAATNTDTVALAIKKTNDPAFFQKHPLLSLLKKTPVEIGCLLQTELQYRDSLFNCDNKNYVNKGDPCKKIKEYYEGVEIPDAIAQKMDPACKNIKLEFEHGNLRQVSITFADSILISKIKTLFTLPSDKSKFPGNVTDIDYGENTFSKDKPVNPNYTRWVAITAFEHLGAGEVQCP